MDAVNQEDPVFLTEVAGRKKRSGTTISPPLPVNQKEEHARSPEKTVTSGATDVFRMLDKLGEKQQQGRNLRNLIQKAAQKTILVVRTKNATQAAENVTIRFHRHQITEIPRAVQLQYVCEKILTHLPTWSSASKKKLQQFQEIFVQSTEVDQMIKDMFWYLTAHCFQTGRHRALEDLFYQRIADNFTSLFIRLQVQPTTRDSGFFDFLPDVLAQILFMSLYEAFPKSRKNMLLTNDVRKQILEICHCWMLGFVPAELKWSHWIPVDQESPKRMAALADFPAMRNRMLRAERVERTKQDVKNRHGAALVELEDDLVDRDEETSLNGDTSSTVLPMLSSNHHHHHQKLQSAAPVYMETEERCVYQMRNSPLVQAFLKRHHLEANASHLNVQLRMTSSKHFDLKHQEALHRTNLPPERRRRLVGAKAYTEALEEIEHFGDTVRKTYASEKKRVQDRDTIEKRQLVMVHRDLDAQLGELRQSNDKIHAYSNLLVSRNKIDTLLPHKADTPKPTPRSVAMAAAAASTVATLPFTPKPPPSRY